MKSFEQLNRKFFACCLHDRPGGEAGKNRQSWKNFVKKSSVRENFLRCAVPLFILNANFMNKETLMLVLNCFIFNISSTLAGDDQKSHHFLVFLMFL